MKISNSMALSLLCIACPLFGMRGTQPGVDQLAKIMAEKTTSLAKEKAAREKQLKEAQNTVQKRQAEQALAAGIEKAHNILTESLNTVIDKLTTKPQDRIATTQELYKTFNQYQVTASLLLISQADQAPYRALKNAIEALVTGDTKTYKKFLKDFDALPNKRATTLQLADKLKKAKKFLEAEQQERAQEKLEEERKQRAQDEKEEQREKEKQQKIDEQLAREKKREKERIEDAVFEMERWAYQQAQKEKEAAEIAKQKALDAASKASEL